MSFKKAKKSFRPLRMIITGKSGSGKTYSALGIATGILENLTPEKKGNGRIALIDTENYSASLNADTFDFDTDSIPSPFLIRDFVEKIQEAKEAEYPILIIDSGSHAWKQILKLIDKLQNQDSLKNKWGAWHTGDNVFDMFLTEMLGYPGHVIMTLRSKMKHVLDVGTDGKSKVKKVGLKPVMRDEIEFEFDITMDAGDCHIFTVDKSRFDEFDGLVIDKPDAEFGKQIIKYLSDAPVLIDDPAISAIQKTKPAIIKPKPNQVVKPMPQDTPRKPATPLPDNKKFNIQHEPIDLSGGALLYDPATAHAAFDPLYKKILQGWNALKYHDIRRSNSIKKHLSVDCLNKCQDAQQLTDYIDYLREQYKAGLK